MTIDKEPIEVILLRDLNFENKKNILVFIFSY